MSDLDYLIKDCDASDLAYACPKHWSTLRPAFSDMVRHCDHCNKKVYLCQTEEQINFYTSVKFCIAVAAPKSNPNVERNPPSSPVSKTSSTEPATHNDKGVMTRIERSTPNVWRRTPSPEQVEAEHHDDIPAFLRKQQDKEDHEIPAFLRRKTK
jgi:hypothetical protein